MNFQISKQTYGKDSRMAKEHFLKHSALTPELLEQLKKWYAYETRINDIFGDYEVSNKELS